MEAEIYVFGFRPTVPHRPLRKRDRARSVFNRLDRISRARALTDLESATLEAAMRELGMI